MAWKLAAGYFGLFAVIIVMAVVIVETVELLIGKNERDVSRSGRWARRVMKLADTLRGAWVLGLAWVFAVSLLNTLGIHDLPTAGDRWKLLQSVGGLFGAWVLVSIVRAGVNARHAGRIDSVARRRGE